MIIYRQIISIQFLFIFHLLFVSAGSLVAQNSESDYVDLSKKKIYYSLSKALRNAKDVYKLNLSNKGLREFPLDVLKLPNLRSLILDSNKIDVIPPQIKELQSLRLLSLSYNNIETMPPALGDLFEMRNLYLDNNRISVLPSEFFRLYKLRSLYLNNNKLTGLPKEIGVFPDLELLNLAYNSIETIPPEIGKLYSLERLSLEHNRLSKFPEFFYELTNLKTLFLSGNLFSSLDPGIAKFKNLEIMALDKNKLSTLPPVMGDMFKLKKLYLEENLLETLPTEMGNLYNLTLLNIGSNPLKSLPASLKNLRSLKHLYVKNISIEPFPQVFFDIQNNGTSIKGLTTKELYQVKLLLSQARNKKLTENYPEAILKYEELLKSDTNNIEALSELAACYLETGEYDKANATCKKALLKDPPVKLLNEIRIIHSNSQNKTNKLATIVAFYEEKIKANPSDANPNFELGKYYYNQGKNEEAKNLFENAITIDPDHAHSHFYLAVVNLVLDKTNPFILSALRYITLEPNSNKTNTMLPFLLSRMSMKTGVEGKRGSTSYFDSYIIRDEDNQIIYKRDTPETDVLIAMLSDLLKTDLTKNNDSDNDTTKDAKKLVAEAMNFNKNNVELFQVKLTAICKTNNDSIPLIEKKSWNYYSPYYRALIENGHLETFSYILNAIRREEPYISKWLKNNPGKVDAFNTWSKNYKWPKE